MSVQGANQPDRPRPVQVRARREGIHTRFETLLLVAVLPLSVAVVGCSATTTQSKPPVESCRTQLVYTSQPGGRSRWQSVRWCEGEPFPRWETAVDLETPEKPPEPPEVRRAGRVVAKRQDTSGMSGSVSTSYFVTFEFAGAEREEFNISGIKYGLLAEGDTGTVTSRGGRFIRFERGETSGGAGSE